MTNAPSANPEIAVLQTQMTDVQKSLGRIETKIDNLDNHYATQQDLMALQSEFTAFKKQNWLSHTLTSVLTAVIVAAIEYIVITAIHAK